ncbi:hypothetical protein BJ983_002774 [Actinomycetospora corticicola]|uniref:Uncharacterized protein n=1 Tax=Actinomycetospora corticicola TaxID=663602 RepID=A0A7Y9DWA3_9PSEU|nr:hypothetical protein [Actinomycetospora corticicola]
MSTIYAVLRWWRTLQVVIAGGDGAGGDPGRFGRMPISTSRRGRMNARRTTANASAKGVIRSATMGDRIRRMDRTGPCPLDRTLMMIRRASSADLSLTESVSQVTHPSGRSSRRTGSARAGPSAAVAVRPSGGQGARTGGGGPVVATAPLRTGIPRPRRRHTGTGRGRVGSTPEADVTARRIARPGGGDRARTHHDPAVHPGAAGRTTGSWVRGADEDGRAGRRPGRSRSEGPAVRVAAAGRGGPAPDPASDPIGEGPG